MTTKTDLDALDALHAAATAGEWESLIGHRRYEVLGNVTRRTLPDGGSHTQSEALAADVGRDNAALIVALRNAWPTVAAELRRARKIADCAMDRRSSEHRVCLLCGVIEWHGEPVRHRDVVRRLPDGRGASTEPCPMMIALDAPDEKETP